MRFVFWGAFALVVYTYLGYPAWLWVRSRLRPCPIQRSPIKAVVSIILVVRNEEQVIRRKLRNLMELDYPAEQTEIIVVSDGSTDGTNQILSEFAHPSRVQVILNPKSSGKAACLNDAIEAAQGEVVVFTDARQQVASDAVNRLLENFADPSVGCASGELIFGSPSSSEVVQGVGLYWKVEKSIREQESASGSVIGATGALYAMRRSLLAVLPQYTILDDVLLPMQTIKHGLRVVLDARAKIWDSPNVDSSLEFARKVRTLTGVYQLLRLEPWILKKSNPVRFEFISHKVLRLVVPFALCAALISSALLKSPLYRYALILQLAFYGVGTLGIWAAGEGLVQRIANVAFTFIMLNAAAVVAFVNFLTGRRPAWGQ
ncbi:MAG TPA: glycosyltransferase family 2 protein [Candidatus Sulfotelmatobacter sp.]|nr:glycosyltransferase family 2 protein [Candidatus Sulfotelmatobacter sp.]